MKFSDRLRLYLFGFLLGLLMVYAFFGNRSCTSLGELKIDELRRQPIKATPESACQLKCINKPLNQIRAELEFFEVNFDKSAPRQSPCRMYYLTPRERFKNFYPYDLIIKDCEQTTLIYQVVPKKEKACPCK